MAIRAEYRLEATNSMAEAVFNGKCFGTVLWGYDRSQVDGLMADYEQMATDLKSDLEQAEMQVGESTRHIRMLEAKVSKLELRAGDTPPDSVRSFADRLDQILREAWEAGRGLRERGASEVEAAQEHAREIASDLIHAANERARLASEEAQHRIDEATVELERLEERRRETLEELTSLQASLDSLVKAA
jgi:chromosome segregation ATPase